MIKIIENPNQELVQLIRKALAENDGYCPCRLSKVPENICICEEFRSQDIGECHCGLYVKVEE